MRLRQASTEERKACIIPESSEGRMTPSAPARHFVDVASVATRAPLPGEVLLFDEPASR